MIWNMVLGGGSGSSSGNNSTNPPMNKISKTTNSSSSSINIPGVENFPNEFILALVSYVSLSNSDTNSHIIYIIDTKTFKKLWYCSPSSTTYSTYMDDTLDGMALSFSPSNGFTISLSGYIFDAGTYSFIYW